MLTKYNDTMSKPDLWRSNIVSAIGTDIFDDLFGINHRQHSRSYRCSENDVEMTIEFDLPGVKPGDVNVAVDGQRLVVTYTQRGEKLEQRFSVRSDYDVMAGKAKLEHGVLELKIPKVEPPKSKKIDIEVK